MRPKQHARLGSRSVMLVASLALFVGLGIVPPAADARRLKPSPKLRVDGNALVCLEGPGSSYVIRVTGKSGYALSGAQVTIANETGPHTLVTGGGFAIYDYKPTQTGTDEWSITASAAGYADAKASPAVAVVVRHCEWTLQLSYAGNWPLKKGFWSYYESMNGPPEIPLSIDKDGKVSGSSSVVLDLHLHGQSTSTECSIALPVNVQVPVTIGGSLERETLSLTLEFGHQNFSGGGQITCDVFGNTVPTMVLPVTGNTIILDRLGINKVVVPASGGPPIPPIPDRTTGIYWQGSDLRGQGRVLFIVRRHRV